MTTIERVTITCPACNHTWTEIIHPSICTWLNPELITEIYEEGVAVQCPECGTPISVAGKILINGPRGMFFLDIGQSVDGIRAVLVNNGVVDTDGNPITSRPQATAASFDDSMYV
ncbi:hypothetical protein EU545_04685 [Candidatus Thorarchaeota archaeon]|nr:MAG: hypothetical protein EU545_04685 [Candidatus Thorarchaeota archaeon]